MRHDEENIKFTLFLHDYHGYLQKVRVRMKNIQNQTSVIHPGDHNSKPHIRRFTRFLVYILKKDQETAFCVTCTYIILSSEPSYKLNKRNYNDIILCSQPGYILNKAHQAHLCPRIHK